LAPGIPINGAAPGISVNGALGAGGGGVTSVSNSDGSLTASPTTGAVVIAIQLSANLTWTGNHTFTKLTVTAGIASGAKLLSSGSPYSVLATDEILSVTTGATGFSVLLPAANANAGRKLLMIKADAGAGAVVIARAGLDTIEGATTKTIGSQYGKVGLVCDGTAVWYDLGTGGGI